MAARCLRARRPVLRSTAHLSRLRCQLLRLRHPGNARRRRRTFRSRLPLQRRRMSVAHRTTMAAASLRVRHHRLDLHRAHAPSSSICRHRQHRHSRAALVRRSLCRHLPVRTVAVIRSASGRARGHPGLRALLENSECCASLHAAQDRPPWVLQTSSAVHGRSSEDRKSGCGLQRQTRKSRRRRRRKRMARWRGAVTYLAYLSVVISANAVAAPSPTTLGTAMLAYRMSCRTDI